MEDNHSNEEREQVEAEDLQREASRHPLSPEEQAEIARGISEQLPIEAKKRLASETVERLPRDVRDELISGLQALSPKERKEIVGLLLPEQRTTNWIWLIIVSSFAVVLILSVVALCAGVLWKAAGEIQILLTVVTTVAGILAGFVSGRASTGGTPS